MLLSPLFCLKFKALGFIGFGAPGLGLKGLGLRGFRVLGVLGFRVLAFVLGFTASGAFGLLGSSFWNTGASDCCCCFQAFGL